MSSPRFAVVSTAVPPASSGQARVLGEILAPGAVKPPVWFSDRLDLLESEAAPYGRHVALTPARFLYRGARTEGWLGQANKAAGLASTVFERARQMTALLREDPVDAIIAASGSPFDLPAAWLAALRLRIPFAAWLFDDPVLQWPADLPYRRFARVWERMWALGAVAIAPNEVMAEDFAARNFGRRPAIVRNPAAARAYAAAPRAPSSQGDPVRIVYTGSLYSAQADAARDLAEALDRFEGRVVWDVYTAQSAETLAGHGVAGRFLRVHPHLDHDASLAAQREADVLFLPLAFDSPIPEVIRSSAPAKMAEYLAALRPILVHAPADAFVCRHFRRTGAGLVVDAPGVEGVAAALGRLLGEAELRAGLVAAAERAREEFRVEASRAALLAAFKGRLAT